MTTKILQRCNELIDIKQQVLAVLKVINSREIVLKRMQRYVSQLDEKTDDK